MNIVKSLVEGYAKINTATRCAEYQTNYFGKELCIIIIIVIVIFRTGAIDVVFVEQEDGTFASTPFHVR